MAKYIGLKNTTLERFSWRVQSNLNGVAQSSPLSRKKKVWKHQPYAKWCILDCIEIQDTFINNCLLNRTKQCCTTCQAAGVGVRAIGTCPGPELGETTNHLEKNIIVLEKKIEIIGALDFYRLALAVNLYLHRKESFSQPYNPLPGLRTNQSTAGGRLKTKSSRLYPWNGLPENCQHCKRWCPSWILCASVNVL